jgi:hypothetical protein
MSMGLWEKTRMREERMALDPEVLRFYPRYGWRVNKREPLIITNSKYC